MLTIILLFYWQCCQAVADAVCLVNDSSGCIVPRILFLDNYFYTGDKANWKWPNGVKMHVLGSLILQSVFRFPSVCGSSPWHCCLHYALNLDTNPLNCSNKSIVTSATS